MNPLVVRVLLGLLIVSAFVAIVAIRRRALPAEPRRDAVSVTPQHARLLAHLRQTAGNHRIYVRKDGDPRWLCATAVSGEQLEIENGPSIALGAVKEFVVTYPSGEILDKHDARYPLPEGAFYTREAPDAGERHDAPSVEELAAGHEVAIVRFGKSRSRPNDKHHYSTTLTNISKERIRILKFGAFALQDGTLQLNTISGGFFTERQFTEWYATPEDGWIAPGGSAMDAYNYGGETSLWVYYGGTESGASFVASGRHADSF